MKRKRVYNSRRTRHARFNKRTAATLQDSLQQADGRYTRRFTSGQPLHYKILWLHWTRVERERERERQRKAETREGEERSRERGRQRERRREREGERETREREKERDVCNCIILSTFDALIRSGQSYDLVNEEPDCT